MILNKFFSCFFPGIAHGGVGGENSPDPASPNAASEWRNVPGSVKENPSIASSCRTSQRGCSQSLHFRYVNSSKLIKTCQSLPEPVEVCQKLSKFVKTWQICQMSEPVKTCQNFSKFESIFFFSLLGLSKVVTDILCAIRMSGSRPYELSCHNGTPSFHVHPVFNHGRANGPRWEPELFYRCFYTKTADFFLLSS